MADATLSQGIFNLIYDNYNAYFIQVYADFMDSFKYVFRAIVVLYTTYVGYSYLSGAEEGLRKLIKTYLLSMFLYFTILETQIYKEYVCDTFVNYIDELSIFFARADSTKIFSALDKQALLFIENTAKVWPFSLDPIQHMVTLVAEIVLYFFYFTMFFSFLAIYCISYFSMSLFLLVGGVFILLGTIEKTRSLFFAWVRLLCQFGLTIVFASMTLGLTFSGITGSIKKLELLDYSNIFSFDFFSIIAWCCITIALFLKSADFAAGLTSTLAGSTAGIAGAMSMAGGGLSTTLVSGGAQAGALGLKGGAWAGGKVIQGATNALEALKLKRGAK